MKKLKNKDSFDPKKDEKFKLFKQVSLLTSIPLILLIAPGIGFFIGQFLDKKIGTDPWFMVVFLILGLIAGAREVYILIKKASEDE